MTKKYFLYASLAALGLAVGACSDELGSNIVPGADGTVTFTAQLPEGLASRADVTFNQGEKATNLSYAVYKSGSTDVIFSSEDAAAPAANYDATTKSFTLSLNLVKGQTYDFVFWADADNSPYTFDPASQTVSISYDEVAGNDDTRDAFFTSISALNVTGAMQKNVELRRPFAQLNIGTDDVDAAKLAKIEHGTTTVSVKDVYSTLNIFDGTATDATTVTFAAHPANEVAFPVAHADANKAYTHLSMNYILTGSVILDGDVNKAQKETKDVSIAFADAAGNAINSFDLSAVPFQRNYRTNIYGSLLTSNVNFAIEVVPGFEEEPGHNHEVVDVWDGETVTTPEKDDAGVYQVNTAAELVGLMDAVAQSVELNAKIELNTSIDLDGNVFQGLHYSDITKNFNGTFDGNGHTIRNFVTTPEGKYQHQYYEGFICSVTGTVKNVVFENVVVGSKDLPYGNCVGVVAGKSYGTIENVTVRNCEVYGHGKVAGLVGLDEEGATYINCTVEDTKVYGVYNAAQLVGCAITVPTITNCTLSGNTVDYNPAATGHTYMTVEKTLGFDQRNNKRQPLMIEGEYWVSGALYSTGAVYYNRYDTDPSNSEGYHIMVNGTEYEVDGYPVNDINTPLEYVDMPADIKPATIKDTKLDGYWNSASTGEYYVTNAAGVANWNKWLEAYRAGTMFGKTYNVMADIDATGIVWTPVWVDPGSTTYNGFVIDGKGHTIKGLTITSSKSSGSGLICGNFRGTSSATVGSVFKNLTIDGATVTGTYHTGVLAGQVYGSVTAENVKIVNSNITGTCNVAAVFGSTSLEGTNPKLTYKNCQVTACTITAKGGTGVDPTGASIFVGRAMQSDTEKTIVTFDGCSEANNTINNADGLYGGGWWATTSWSSELGGFTTPVVHNSAE